LDVCKHFLLAFATLGVPRQIKTDNGPAYTSQQVLIFFQDWEICHITGIPHSSTGQVVVGRAHST
ncbi:POK10 protein, partial [Penelope pileata]|nr:POK10 protein [Penelope pileata]